MGDVVSGIIMLVLAAVGFKSDIGDDDDDAQPQGVSIVCQVVITIVSPVFFCLAAWVVYKLPYRGQYLVDLKGHSERIKEMTYEKVYPSDADPNQIAPDVSDADPDQVVPEEQQRGDDSIAAKIEGHRLASSEEENYRLASSEEENYRLASSEEENSVSYLADVVLDVE